LGGDDILTGSGSLTGDSERAHIYATATADNGSGSAIAISGNIEGGDDKLSGGAGADSLIGDSYSATTEAGASSFAESATATAGDIIGGDDTIRGNEGHDTIIGDYVEVESSSVITVADIQTTSTVGTLYNGDDIIEGGAGNDRMWGDSQDVTGANVVAGDDKFVFRSDAIGTYDLILDYDAWDDVNGGDTLVFYGYEEDQITASPIGGDTELTLTSGQVIFIVGVAETDLHFSFM